VAHCSNLQTPRALTGWIEQLEECAHKAIARCDTQAAAAITRTMISIGSAYADARRDSLVLQPDFTALIPTLVSDVGKVLDPMYESLKDICDDAVKQPNEAVVIACIRALGNMAAHTLTIIDTQNRLRSAPLAYSPVFYIDLGVQRAIAANMDDALLAAITSIARRCRHPGAAARSSD
jgi:hypothetical protein